MNKQIQIGIIALVFLGATVLTSTAQQNPIVFEPLKTCFYSWTKATDLCGFVRVPENRADTNNLRQIKIAVIVRQASQPNPLPDPIVVLEGGPGGSATATFIRRLGELSKITLDRDLILIDQRGTGYSEPLLDCSEEVVQQPKITSLAQLALCRERLEKITDLSAYNTEQNAQDIQAAIQALGYKTWNVLGISYGTRLALKLLEKYHKGIRSAVLDGVLGTHINAVEQSGAILQVWNRIHVRQKALINNIAQSIERKQIPASIAALWFVVFSSSDEADLTENLLALRNGKTQWNDPPAFRFSSSPDRDYSYAMALSTMCQEEFANSDVKNAIKTLDSSWNKALTEYMFRTSFFDYQNILLQCKIWNVGRAERSTEFVKTPIPVLVLNDTHDLNTPLEWATATAKNLGNAQQVVTKTLRHVITTRSCGAKLAQIFIENPNIKNSFQGLPECNRVFVSASK